MVQDKLLSRDAKGDPDLMAEQEKSREYYKREREFYECFSQKFEIYDPLDRPTPQEKNQALKTSEVL